MYAVIKLGAFDLRKFHQTSTLTRESLLSFSDLLQTVYMAECARTLLGYNV